MNDDESVKFNRDGRLVYIGKTVKDTILNSLSADDTKNYLISVNAWHNEKESGGGYMISDPYGESNDKTPSTAVNKDGTIKRFSANEKLQSITNIIMHMERVTFIESMERIIDTLRIPPQAQVIIDQARSNIGLNSQEIARRNQENLKEIQKRTQELREANEIAAKKREENKPLSRKIIDVREIQDVNLKKYIQEKGIDLLGDLRQVKYQSTKEGSKPSWQKIGFPNIYSQIRLKDKEYTKHIPNLSQKVGFEIRGIGADGVPNDKSAAGHKTISFIKGKNNGSATVFESFTSAGAALKLSKYKSTSKIPENDIFILNSTAQSNLFTGIIKTGIGQKEFLSKEEGDYTDKIDEINAIVKKLGGKFKYKKVNLYLDNDKAGANATKKIEKSLEGVIKTQDIRFFLGDQKDPSDLFKTLVKEGADFSPNKIPDKYLKKTNMLDNIEAHYKPK